MCHTWCLTYATEVEQMIRHLLWFWDHLLSPFLQVRPPVWTELLSNHQWPTYQAGSYLSLVFISLVLHSSSEFLLIPSLLFIFWWLLCDMSLQRLQLLAPTIALLTVTILSVPLMMQISFHNQPGSQWAVLKLPWIVTDKSLIRFADFWKWVNVHLPNHL